MQHREEAREQANEVANPPSAINYPHAAQNVDVVFCTESVCQLALTCTDCRHAYLNISSDTNGTSGTGTQGPGLPRCV